MIHYMPKFYYSGSKQWDIPSDRIFIEKKLNRLNMANQKIISEQYEEIFKHYHNRGEWRKAREIANGMLNDAANDFGLSLSEYKKLKVANDDFVGDENVEEAQARADALVENAKRAQKLAKPRIHFKDLKRA